MCTATAPAKTGQMRKAVLAVLACAVVCSSAPTALALDPMGPPVAGLEQGQFKTGLEFSFSEMDLETTNGTFLELLDGVFFDAGEATSFTIKDFEIAKTYLNLGYGFADIFEGFLRVGGTKGEFGDSIWEDAEEFDSGNGLAVGGGLKVTFLEQDGLKLGGLFQGSYSGYHGKMESPNWTGPDFVEIDLTEIQIAVGASYTWAERFSIYGGPFLHFVGGELDNAVGASITGGGELLNSQYLWDLDEDSVFGGYIGAQLEIAEGCSVNIEYQKTAAADAFGASILWRF
ncbi:MAG: outer membrane beta-barrel protein [Phycisphaerales bacterium]|nr:MAG: outer membrane beta-barrel protein [Phycisphaerales bacterium]